MKIQGPLPLHGIKVVSLQELHLKAESVGDGYMLAAFCECLTKGRFPKLRMYLAESAERIAIETEEGPLNVIDQRFAGDD